MHDYPTVIAPRKALNCLACCWLGQPVSMGRSKWASKGLGWACGSHFDFGMSSRLPLEPELVPCGWRCPFRRLTLLRPFGIGNGKTLLGKGLQVPVMFACVQSPQMGLKCCLQGHQQPERKRGLLGSDQTLHDWF
jgi:hypothetical protein